MLTARDILKHLVSMQKEHPLWKMVWQCLKKLSVLLSYGSAIQYS